VWGWSKLLPTISGTYTFEATYNNITCSSTFDIVNPSSVASVDGQSGIEIFPNPATSELIIENEELKIEKVELYNTVGEKVFEKRLTSDIQYPTISVANFSPGIYFITVTDNAGNKVTKKIVKM
jgi:hypothetical protein